MENKSTEELSIQECANIASGILSKWEKEVTPYCATFSYDDGINNEYTILVEIVRDLSMLVSVRFQFALTDTIQIRNTTIVTDLEELVRCLKNIRDKVNISAFDGLEDALNDIMEQFFKDLGI